MSAIHMLSAVEDAQVGIDTIWTNVTTGAEKFTNGILAPVMNTIVTNPIPIMFLSSTFIGLGVRIVRKIINAFGRGR